LIFPDGDVYWSYMLSSVTNEITLSVPETFQTPPPAVGLPSLLPPSQSIPMIVINLFFIVLGILSFLWIVLGTPLGIIFLIVYLVNRSDPAKKKFLKLGLFSLAGLPVGFILLVVITFLWGLFQSTFGIGSLKLQQF